MNTGSLIAIIVTIILVAGAATALIIYKKKKMEKLFNQISLNAKQVPKQKKHSFILLMFMESVANSKKKTTVKMGQMTNPKQLDIQLLRMSQILKDKENVTDKGTKRALTLLKQYLTWEKLRNGGQLKPSKKVS